VLSIVNNLSPEQLTGPSDCSDWTIAQVLSHLGSGAEIFSLIVEAGLTDGQPPSNDVFPAIWDAWNSKDPVRQAEDFIGVDTALVEQFESLDDKRLGDFKISMFGMDLDAAGVLGLRLSEHALHSWDVAVVLDPAAKVAQAATELLIDNVVSRAGRMGKPVGGPLQVHIETSDPERTFTLKVDENVELVSGSDQSDEGGDAMRLEISAEAFLRLLAGRMDPDHTPSEVKAEGVGLDSLRAVFPGI
jgi:uncharacterized protein (TIGR03083 family)